MDFDKVKSVILQTSIRGLHATGVSYIKDAELVTIKRPIPASQFLLEEMSDYSKFVNEDENLYLIAHCRYSTSDLEFNQPLSLKDVSIVHNGVITQTSPDTWKEQFGYDCETKNDSELLLRAVADNKNPFIEFGEPSIASCELHRDKKLRFYRNGKRPLYYIEGDEFLIVSSTKDSLDRSEFNQQTPRLTLPFTNYCFIPGDKVSLLSTLKNPKNKDLQV